MDKQVRYIFDRTNSYNLNNLVRQEKHYLENRRFKCIALTHGSFFARNVRVFQDKTNYELVHNKDYVYSDIDVEASETIGEPVANVIIVINNKLGRSFLVDYFAVGLPQKEVTKRTVALLETPNTGDDSDSYLDVKNKPEQFKPTFHYQTLSEIEHFEETLFYLEKIRIALVYEMSAPIRDYLKHIEDHLQILYSRGTSVFMNNIELRFKNFRDSFNKLGYGVDKIKNIGLITTSTAFNMASGKDKSVRNNGLLALKALVGFKAGVYNTFLASDNTLLGGEHGIYIPPTLDNYFKLLIGSTVLIDTYSNNINNDVSIDRMAYPHLLRSNTRYNVRKIVNDTGNRCIVVATEINASNVYVGKISKTNMGYLAEWKEIVRPNAIQTTLVTTSSHLSNRGNPHKDTKEHVELDLVENIPVASLLDIVNNSKERKYLRWDLLDKYMKKFLLGRRPNKTEQLVDKDENLMRNISVVFSQCGRSCTGTNECAVIEPVYTTTTTTTTTTTKAPPVPTYSINTKNTFFTVEKTFNNNNIFYITTSLVRDDTVLYYKMSGPSISKYLSQSDMSGAITVLNNKTQVKTKHTGDGVYGEQADNWLDVILTLTLHTGDGVYGEQADNWLDVILTLTLYTDSSFENQVAVSRGITFYNGESPPDDSSNPPEMG